MTPKPAWRRAMEEQDANRYDVFLSFNSRDRAAVKRIAESLRDRFGLCPWFDEWDVKAGDRLVKKLYQGLEAVPVYAVFLGQKGEGPWQSPEIETAVYNCVNDPQRRIIPVFLPSAPENPVLPPFLKGYKWVDFRGRSLDDPDALGQLVEGIRQAMPPDEGDPSLEVLSSDERDRLHTAYLNALFEQVSPIYLAQIDRQAEKETGRTLNLGAIYTALLTQSTEQERPWVSSFDEERQNRRLSAVAQVNQHPRLVLLGDPGSGKSTFVNFVVMCLAGEWLQKDAANLARLREPLPQDDGTAEDEPQPWEHGALLPVRVILRDFAAHTLPEPQQPGTARHLWRFLRQKLQEAGLGRVLPVLREELQMTGGFILLDGLDEVPEERRRQIKQSIEDFARVFPACRMLVTSRTYAYQQQAWQLEGFQQARLALFSDGQIRRFIDCWYGHVGVLRGMNAGNAQGRAELLKHEIFSTPRLHEFAQRPLLLTLMASLHAWRVDNLPEKREELYAEATILLLEWWEGAKVVRNAEGQMEVVQESLSELLRVGRQAVREVLESLAFEAHAGQTADQQDTADIPEETLKNALLKIKGEHGRDKDLRPYRLVEYLSDRAGLLVQGRDGQSYTFPHRTFQEYLAACHLTAQVDDYPENIARLA
ncbi:TIR domain-containing protein, partial [candidate division KSB3 bacterium]|nr:TIR domain-containing protein [candidate division KSB3 bacterium]MBD3324509.1 TIR domain-containing protein [candidate division KSB3 bacterium]